MPIPPPPAVPGCVYDCVCVRARRRKLACECVCVSDSECCFVSACFPRGKCSVALLNETESVLSYLDKEVPKCWLLLIDL